MFVTVCSACAQLCGIQEVCRIANVRVLASCGSNCDLCGKDNGGSQIRIGDGHLSVLRQKVESGNNCLTVR
jgi:hypothetical protein